MGLEGALPRVQPGVIQALDGIDLARTRVNGSVDRSIGSDAQHIF